MATAATPSTLGLGTDEQYLLWLCAVGLGLDTPRPPIPAGINWTHVVALARRHRVIPLVWRVRKRMGLDLPPSAAEELREGDRQNAMHGLHVAAHLLRMVKALNAAGIPALPLKGICLALRYYDDIAARYAGDIDLLVPRAEVDRADDVLRGLGYLRVANKTRTVVGESFEEDTDYRLHYIYISRDGVPLELHFQLHNNPDVLAVDVAGVIAEGMSVAVGGTRLPIMPDDLQFVFLATHGARHEWVRLQWLCDIAVMMKRARPGEVAGWLAFAKRHSLTNPVVQAMVLAERLFALPPTPEIAPRYRRSRRIRYMVQRAEHTMFADQERKIDKPLASFDIGRRVYRMSMTGRPVYLWHELRNGWKAVSARFARSVTPSP